MTMASRWTCSAVRPEAATVLPSLPRQRAALSVARLAASCWRWRSPHRAQGPGGGLVDGAGRHDDAVLVAGALDGDQAGFDIGQHGGRVSLERIAEAAAARYGKDRLIAGPHRHRFQ